MINDEERFIKMAIEGSLDAFNRLVVNYQTCVYNTALRVMQDPLLADDITQMAFINAWKHMDSFNGAAFKPWILRITINACYDELRRMRRHPEQDLMPQNSEDDDENEDVPWLIDPSAGPVEEMEAREQRELIKECFEKLPTEYRTVFMLIDLQDEDYQTTADILGKPLGTIKSRLLRARLRMRDCLKSKGIEGV